MSQSHHRRPLLGALGVTIVWSTLIFATSCTVVRPGEFFAIIHRFVLTDDALMSRFEAFWGFVWLFVVKGWHFTEFAILSLLCQMALLRFRPEPAILNIVVAAAAAILFAISDEWHQTFVPGRGGTVFDVLIDSLGVLLATLYSLRHIRSNRTACGS
ncbi:MAG: VanZ family protein [Planctomycetaceae bacterium]